MKSVPLPGDRAREFLREVDPGVDRPRGRPALVAYAGFAYVALLLVLGSAALVQRADSREQAANMGFGYPVHFVYVDRAWQWGAAGGPQGPFSARFNPWEDTPRFRMERFVVDWALVSWVLWAPLLLYRHRRR